jgi:excisionase family DNA binding protein
MSSVDRQVYSPEEVATLLGLHTNSVYSMLKSGELPGIKTRRRWLISKRRFDSWLDGGEN